MSAEPTRAAVVTGAYGAIGKAIAGGLAERGFSVIMVGRNAAALEAAAAEIRSRAPGRDVEAAVVDLSREASIAAFAEALGDRPISVLVNDAASCPRRREETPEGIERQLATNVLGYYWMVRYLEPALGRGAPSRVVNVASYWAGDLDLDDLQFRRRRYDNDTAYRQSKQADRMMTVALAERLRPLGITVNACHPGDVRSKLSTSLGYGGHQSPEEGADTPLWLAAEAPGEHTGGYFAGRRLQRCQFAGDTRGIARLMEACAALSSPAPPMAPR